MCSMSPIVAKVWSKPYESVLGRNLYIKDARFIRTEKSKTIWQKNIGKLPIGILEMQSTVTVIKMPKQSFLSSKSGSRRLTLPQQNPFGSVEKTCRRYIVWKHPSFFRGDCGGFFKKLRVQDSNLRPMD